MPVKERLREYLKYKKINERQFCLSIGVSTSYIHSIRVSIQPQKLSSIAEYYPDLNTSWLLTGEGEMVNNNDKNQNSNSLHENETVAYLIEANKGLQRTIDNQAEIIKRMHRIIDNLQEKK